MARVVGLIRAAKYFNDRFRQEEISASVIILLRSDIWSTIKFEDKNKLSQSQLEEIKWSREDGEHSLKKLMERRFSALLGRGSCTGMKFLTKQGRCEAIKASTPSFAIINFCVPEILFSTATRFWPLTRRIQATSTSLTMSMSKKPKLSIRITSCKNSEDDFTNTRRNTRIISSHLKTCQRLPFRWTNLTHLGMRCSLFSAMKTTPRLRFRHSSISLLLDTYLPAVGVAGASISGDTKTQEVGSTETPNFFRCILGLKMHSTLSSIKKGRKTNRIGQRGQIIAIDSTLR